MDRNWMRASRTSEEYDRGVENFIKFALDNAVDPTAILCPCVACVNVVKLNVADIRGHLYFNGIDKSYTRWIWHGEEVLSSFEESLFRARKEHMVEENIEDNLVDMVNDANERFIDHPKLFQNILDDVETSLYSGCTKFTKLSALVRLWNLKAGGGWTNTSFTLLLELIRDMLPEDNMLPTSMYEAKKTLSSLGMDYEKIHACPNDCILYRKENADLDSCPRCEASRWKKGKEPSKEKKGVPAKVLWYIPPIPRFRRMFRNPNHAKSLTWHADRVITDDKLRHPADSPQWKAFDMQNPEFSAETRNLRLGLSADGINPHSNFSSRHSSWPVVLVIYNLPPWLCMKRRFLMLSLLISGPRQPGNDIDVYLKPLIDDLKKLWETGIEVEDAHQNQKFTLRAMLIWTINDFPAYSNLSGYCIKTATGCPICGDDTYSTRLKNGGKYAYIGHRRFLPQNHQYRRQKKAFNGEIENGKSPRPLSGEQVFQMVKNLDIIFGKPNKNTSSSTLWKKRSIFFELPYWKTLLVRHNLDVMHIEKNVCEAIIGTLLDIPGKTKDGIKARLDLVEMKIREQLAPEKRGNRTFLPPAKYSLSRKEKKTFCECLTGVKVPQGYSSNIKNLVSMKDLKLLGMKSHDCHTLMQHLLPIAIRGVLPKEKEVRVAITKLCFFFNAICSTVVDPSKLDALQADVVKTLCLLEKFFPPSFFDIMIHLTVHLVREVKLCGPVFLRWMYPFERYMKILKGYVKNRNKPEGSIVESYIAEEVVEFCSEYLADAAAIGIPKARHSSHLDSRGTSAAIPINVEHDSWAQAHLYVLHNSSMIEPYITEHMNHLRDKNQKRSEKWMQDEHNRTFRNWLKDYIVDKLEQPNHDISDDVKWLALGPSLTVITYTSYVINGYCFYTNVRDEKHPVQNSGVSLIAEAMHVSSAKDKNPVFGNMCYYGVIKDIWELDYCGIHVPLFRCKWVDNSAVKIDELGFTLVDFRRQGYKSEPFILASQAKQVFYVTDPLDSHWSIVLSMKPRVFNEDTNELDNQSDEITSFSKGLPSVEDIDMMDDQFYDSSDLRRLEGEWICIDNPGNNTNRKKVEENRKKRKRL